MVILGSRYTFMDNEIALIEEKFGKINFIDYKQQTPEATIRTLIDLADKGNAKLIVLNTKAKVPNSIVSLLTRLELSGVKYMTLENFMETHLCKCFIDYDNNDLSYLQNIQPYTWTQSILKTLIDFSGIFLLSLLSWPMMLHSYFKIRRESSGSILYKQLRVGKKAEEFECIKFRSMVMDAEKDGIKFASKNDSRVFPWGKTMRKKRLDELPQMLNILKGQMHLVGPRPERKYWVDKFEKNIPYYNERHIVKPGITGWAQVMYGYGENEEDARQKLMYDLYYIKNWSILLEIKIIWKTIFVVFGKIRK